MMNDNTDKLDNGKHDAPYDDPFRLSREWLAEAKEKELNDPEAMALASVGADGMPSLRMVLLKAFDEQGFVFYTNLDSRKGQELIHHPKAALLFHWKSLRRQIRVEGLINSVTLEEADEYFASRPRLSQIGAWASQQSKPLRSRLSLEAEVARYTAKFGLGTVPRPPHWSGFRLCPVAFEFWRDGAFRLHDRWRFERAEQVGQPEITKLGWQISRLYP